MKIQRRVEEIAKKATGPALRRGYLAAPYDGIGSSAIVTLSKASSSGIQASVAAGAFGTEQTFPAGTPVMVLEYSGRLEIVSLGSKLGAGSITIDMIPSSGLDASLLESPLIAPGTLPGSSLAEGSLPGTILEDGTIPIAAFASTIRPVVLVTGALPTLPDTDYPVGTFAYKTDDVPPRLYKNVAEAWVAAIGPDDIQANSITAGQIAAGAISTTELAVGAFTGNLIKNGSFEDVGGTAGTAYTLNSDDLRGWTLRANGTAQFGTSASAKSGTRACTMKGDGVTANPGIQQLVPVTAGRTYRLRAWSWKALASGVAARVRANTYDKSGVAVSFNVISLNWAVSTTPVQYEGTYTVPTDGTVSYLMIECIANGTPTNTEVFAFEDVELIDVTENVLGAGGNVVIDASGILIKNGVLSLEDEFGTTVAGASGFSGGWSDYVSAGIYNHAFASGLAGTLSDGRTSGLPYWTVSRVGGAVVSRQVNSSFPSGFAVRFAVATIGDTGTIISDLVPCLGGIDYGYAVIARMSKSLAGSEVRLGYGIRFYDKDGVYISGPTTFASHSSPATGTTSIAAEQSFISSTAPLTARFMAVRVYADLVTLNDPSAWAEVGLVSIRPAAAALVKAGDYRTSYMNAGYLTVSGNYIPGASGHGELWIDEDGAETVLDGVGSQVFRRLATGVIDNYASNAVTAFTPGHTQFGTATFTSKTGYWQRIGNMIYVQMRLVIDVAGSGTSAIGVGLPVTANVSGVATPTLNGFCNATGGGPCVGLIAGGGSADWVDRIFVGTSALTGADMTAGRVLTLAGWYQAA